MRQLQTCKSKTLKAQAKERAELEKELRFLDKADIEKQKQKLHKEMIAHADNLEFEKAIEIRAKIKKLEDLMLDITD